MAAGRAGKKITASLVIDEGIMFIFLSTALFKCRFLFLNNTVGTGHVEAYSEQRAGL